MANENPKEAVELSQEEMTAKRDEITKYYKDHIPHLTAQLEYENLLKDIEKCRAERMQAQAFMTKMAATPPEPSAQVPQAPPAPQAANVTNLTPNKEKVKRTLKKAESNG
jgi:hypothetical protein